MITRNRFKIILVFICTMFMIITCITESFAFEDNGKRISGCVYLDINCNGIKEEGENPLENVKIILYKAERVGTSDPGVTVYNEKLLTECYTNKFGEYEFNVKNGEYSVTLDVNTLPSGTGVIKDNISLFEGSSGYLDFAVREIEAIEFTDEIMKLTLGQNVNITPILKDKSGKTLKGNVNYISNTDEASFEKNMLIFKPKRFEDKSIEIEVSTDINDYVGRVNGYLLMPQIGLNDPMEDHYYMDCIFFIFLDEFYGGYQRIKSIWETLGTGIDNGFTAIDNNLSASGYNLRTVFKLFTAYNYNPKQFYSEGDLWISAWERFIKYQGNYPWSVERSTIGNFGSEYINFYPLNPDYNETLKYTFDADDYKEFGLQLLKINHGDSLCASIEDIGLDGTQNRITLTVNELGATYANMVFVPSYLNFEWSFANYEFSAEILHEQHYLDESVTITEPTCYREGTKRLYCVYPGCNYFVNVPIPPLEHNMGSWYITANPTCTTDGSKKRECQNSGCSYNETGTIPATGHSMGGWYVASSPTCTTSGLERRDCYNCSYSETSTIPATGHNMGGWYVASSPTCTTDGTERRDCQNSGCGHYESRKISAYGHNYVQTETGSLLDATTCPDEKHYGGYKCSRCSTWSGETWIMWVFVGHDWSDWYYMYYWDGVTFIDWHQRDCYRCGAIETTRRFLE